MFKVLSLIFTVAVLMVIVGCGTKEVETQKVDELANAPQWVLYEPFEKAKIVKVAKSTLSGSFREKRDEAYKLAKEKIEKNLQVKIDKIFKLIDTKKNYQLEVQEKKRQLLKELLELSKMQKIYESMSGVVYLYVSLDLKKAEKELDRFFQENMQRYKTLYKNYMVSKSNGDIHIIMINQ
jgi:hypothetical protein